MSSFKHLDGMVALLSELYEINERVMCGDLVSAKAAIASDRMKKLLNHYHEALHEDGATNVSLQAYVAAGGWAGVVPITTTYGPPMRAPDCPEAIEVPPSVLGLSGALTNRRRRPEGR